jgi:hypothetical protein
VTARFSSSPMRARTSDRCAAARSRSSRHERERSPPTADVTLAVDALASLLPGSSRKEPDRLVMTDGRDFARRVAVSAELPVFMSPSSARAGLLFWTDVDSRLPVSRKSRVHRRRHDPRWDI